MFSQCEAWNAALHTDTLITIIVHFNKSFFALKALLKLVYKK